MLEDLLARLPYVGAIALVSLGLGVLVGDPDRLKKVVGLNLFQTGVLLFFVASAYRTGGRSVLAGGPAPPVNPLPHVLVLTAIVVGVSLTALALSLVVRIRTEASVPGDKS